MLTAATVGTPVPGRAIVINTAPFELPAATPYAARPAPDLPAVPSVVPADSAPAVWVTNVTGIVSFAPAAIEAPAAPPRPANAVPPVRSSSERLVAGDQAASGIADMIDEIAAAGRIIAAPGYGDFDLFDLPIWGNLALVAIGFIGFVLTRRRRRP